MGAPTARPRLRLALDHHYSPKIAQRLRDKEHDVLAVIELGWELEQDEALLALCREEKRALLTNNVADFVVIARRWMAQGESHAGIVFTSDVSMPRSRKTIGRYVEALDRLMRERAGDEALLDQIWWL